MKRYHIIAVHRDGTRVVYGGERGYQNAYAADGAAKMLLELDAEVERVEFQCISE